MLELAEPLGIPVVFDAFHHELAPSRGELTIREATLAARATWRPQDGRQEVHFSTQEPGKRPGAHAETIDDEAFLAFASHGSNRRSAQRSTCSTLLVVDDRQHRMAQNEALFREVNERVEDVAHRLGPDVPYEFVCECANADCTFRVELSIGVYETIRSDPKQFVVLPLHYTPEIEELVAEEETYWLVRKTGETGEYVEHLDPRSR